MIKLATKECWTALPDAVLFDLDNTLYPYAPAHAAGMAAVRVKVTKTFSIAPASFDEAFDRARNSVKMKLAGTGASHSRLLYFQRMLELIGLGSQVLLAIDLEQTYWRTFLNKAALFEDVREFLDDIRLLGIPTALVTDLTAHIQFRKVLYFKLDTYFDYIVTSEEAGFDKPHAAPFRLAMEKLSPAGNRVWMIGDDPEADMRGAKEAIKAITLLKRHGSRCCGGGAQHIACPDASFEDFGALRTFVATLRRG